MGLGSREPLGHRLELSSDEERCSESCSFPKPNQLMNVCRCNRGSRLPRANSKNIFLQHPLELWLAPGLACLGSRNPPCYQLWAPLGKALQKFSRNVCKIAKWRHKSQEELWYCSPIPACSKYSLSVDLAFNESNT